MRSFIACANISISQHIPSDIKFNHYTRDKCCNANGLPSRNFFGSIILQMLEKHSVWGKVPVGNWYLFGQDRSQPSHMYLLETSNGCTWRLLLNVNWEPVSRCKRAIYCICVVTDLSHSETRLSVYLDNFELHVYNRTAVYSNLEKLFGLDQLLPQPSESAPELVASVLDSCHISVSYVFQMYS